MDEHEMMAFELELILNGTRGTAKLVPAYADALKKSIKNHRELSRTYRPYDEVVDPRKLRNSS